MSKMQVNEYFSVVFAFLMKKMNYIEYSYLKTFSHEHIIVSDPGGDYTDPDTTPEENQNPQIRSYLTKFTLYCFSLHKLSNLQYYNILYIIILFLKFRLNPIPDPKNRHEYATLSL